MKTPASPAAHFPSHSSAKDDRLFSRGTHARPPPPTHTRTRTPHMHTQLKKEKNKKQNIFLSTKVYRYRIGYPVNTWVPGTRAVVLALLPYSILCSL